MQEVLERRVKRLHKGWPLTPHGVSIIPESSLSYFGSHWTWFEEIIRNFWHSLISSLASIFLLANEIYACDEPFSFVICDLFACWWERRISWSKNEKFGFNFSCNWINLPLSCHRSSGRIMSSSHDTHTKLVGCRSVAYNMMALSSRKCFGGQWSHDITRTQSTYHSPARSR